MISDFSTDGNLPPGVHLVNDWQELVDRFGTTPHRLSLLSGLRGALKALQVAGCEHVFLDGSFVTRKETPSDFDACWETQGVDPTKLDPILLTFDPDRATQKAKFGGELFPASANANRAGKTYLEFFQQDKHTGRPKGIVAIDLQAIQL